MRKSRQETAETRQRIVEAASKQFRSNGIDGTGLDALMGAAGLTHGGFYKHFESKEQLIVESLALSVESWLEGFRLRFSAVPGNRGIQVLIAEYLSTDHLDDAACGCPFVALGSELARDSEPVREAMTTGFKRVVDVISSQIEGMTPAAAKKEAVWILSTMIGAVTMARVVTDPDVSTLILREARQRLTRSL